MLFFNHNLFSRTQKFYKAFADALIGADHVILTDIYPAREKPIPGISSKLIFDQLSKKDTKEHFYLKDLDKLQIVLDDLIGPDSIVLTLGAGKYMAVW